MPVIYLVDDEPVCLDAMRTFLTVLGYECCCCRDAESLLKEVENGDSRDVEQGVILADFRLPGMNGLQLFERLRTSEIRMPFVLISGHADADLVERSLDIGVSAFLQKPMDFGELKETISRCVGTGISEAS